MEQLHNGFTLKLSPGAFPLSTDSIALAHFAKLSKDARVLDLGAGCGTLGLYLCALHNSCQVTGVEIDENAHLTALSNGLQNHISHRNQCTLMDTVSASSGNAKDIGNALHAHPPDIMIVKHHLLAPRFHLL